MAVKLISQGEYNQFLGEGYLAHRETQRYHNASVGRYVILRKPLGLCERACKIFGCILIFPVACICAPCCKELVSDCGTSLCCEPIDGYQEQKGFVKNKEETAALRIQDFTALNIECGPNGRATSAALKKFVLRQIEEGKQITQCPQYRDHFYFSFYGPASRFSFIILIPYNNYDDMQLFPVFNREGGSCNAAELKDKARVVCGGYKPGVKTISTATERDTLISGTYVNPYGVAGHLTIHAHKERIVS